MQKESFSKELIEAYELAMWDRSSLSVKDRIFVDERFHEIIKIAETRNEPLSTWKAEFRKVKEFIEDSKRDIEWSENIKI